VSPRPPLTPGQQRMLDRYKLFTGTLALILGLVMLYRMLTGGGSVTGWLLGLAFVGFGLVRVRILIGLLTGRRVGR